jgi:hypothetical protein
MPTRDPYHDLVKNALRKDGWRVTYDVLPLKRRTVSEAGESWTMQLLAADKDERKIAVAVNSFIGRSDLATLSQALAQLALSRPRVHAVESTRVLYLAVRQATYTTCFTEPEGRLLLARQPTPLLVFDPRTEAVVQWVP